MTDAGQPPPAREDVALRAWLGAEIARPFSGWDFTALVSRWHVDALPFDYRDIVQATLSMSAALLDLGTGGGEFLAGLAPLPPIAHATEGYPPNLRVARARLAPLGVAVSPVAEDAPGVLPYADATFDLIIDRHEYYDPREVWRVLRPGGRFITQQVGGENYVDIPRALGAREDRTFAAWELAKARAELAGVGFTIVRAEEAFLSRYFHDVGALAYYLTAIPWEVPDFTLDRYFPALQALQRRCETDGAIMVRQHRFLLIGERPVD